jgi:hypothetical protein
MGLSQRKNIFWLAKVRKENKTGDKLSTTK